MTSSRISSTIMKWVFSSNTAKAPIGRASQPHEIAEIVMADGGYGVQIK